MLKYPCENLPAWRVPPAAEQLTGLPVGMPAGHLELDAATWLGILMANDAAGIRESEEPEQIDRDAAILDYLREHPDSTEREVRAGLQERGQFDGDSHVNNQIIKLERHGLVEKSGETHYQHGKYTAIAAFKWRVVETEEVTV